MSNVSSKIKNVRNKRKCLFIDIGACRTNGRTSCENNHIIAMSGYLKPISEKGKVMIFAWEEQDYYKNGGKLIERTIGKANRYKVLCGEHDQKLFSEIENGKNFNASNLKQHFQFYLRSFVFKYAETEVKQEFELVDKTFEKVAKINLEFDSIILKKLKDVYINGNYNYIESKTIILKNYTSHFVSTFYGRPICDISMPLITTGRLTINIFQEDNDVVVLLCYTNDSAKSIKNYCEKLCKYAKSNEKNFIEYITKLSVSSDANIAINPVYWNSLNSYEQKSFYTCANYFRKNSGFVKPLIKWLRFSRKTFNFRLITKN